MKPGISTYTYTWAIGVPGTMPDKPMTIFQLLEKAVELGVGVVQIADNLPLDKFSKRELLEIRSVAEDLNVNIEVGARGMTLKNLQKYIELAGFFNSPILRFVIDGKDFHPDVKHVISLLKQIVPKLEKEKISLAIENHDRFKSNEFVEIVTKANSDFVGICLDSVNSMGAGEGLETVIENLAPLTINLHMKEFSIYRFSHNMGFIIEGSPLGEGMLPVKELLRKIPKVCTSAILEQWTPPEESIYTTIEKEAFWAEKSVAYLIKIINK